MALQIEGELDALAWKILVRLQQDARKSFRQLGQEIGLSAPAVAERVRKLEAAGVITGYHAAIDPRRAGFSVLAQMRIGGVGDRGAEFVALLAAAPEVLECYRVTGSDSYLVKVLAVSVEHLAALIDRFVPFGDVTTSLVLSTPVQRRVIEAPLERKG